MRSPEARRFRRFAVVGIAGFTLQLSTVYGLTRAGLSYLPATAFGVEAAILHNYLWHERWTWRDRPGTAGSRIRRAFRFHGLTAGVSLLGNVALAAILSGGFGWPPLLSNAVAVILLSAVNFAGADRLVFRDQPKASACAAKPSCLVSVDRSW